MPSPIRPARTRAAHDVFDVRTTDADIAQLIIGELRQFAHRLSVPEPSVDLLRNRFERDHINSLSGAPRRLRGRETIAAGAHSGAAGGVSKVLRESSLQHGLVASVPELMEERANDLRSRIVIDAIGGGAGARCVGLFGMDLLLTCG